MQTIVTSIRPVPADAPTRWVVETDTTWQDGEHDYGIYSIDASEVEEPTDELIGAAAVARAEAAIAPMAAQHGEPT